MSRQTLETVERLLEAVLEETDDPDVHFKLRTALQLLAVQEREVDQLNEVAAQSPELETRLRELGYLD